MNYESPGVKSNLQQQCGLKVVKFNEGTIEIELENLYYSSQRARKIKQMLVLISGYVLYRLFPRNLRVLNENIREPWLQVPAFEVLFLMILVAILHGTLQLTRKEKLVFIRDFALTLEVTKFLARKSSMFIPASAVYDICVNEVIEQFNVHYILIVRTKGQAFNLSPIIPVFKTLKPTIEHLEIVYKNLQQVSA